MHHNIPNTAMEGAAFDHLTQGQGDNNHGLHFTNTSLCTHAPQAGNHSSAKGSSTLLLGMHMQAWIRLDRLTATWLPAQYTQCPHHLKRGDQRESCSIDRASITKQCQTDTDFQACVGLQP